ncbi:hypothetical protein [Sphingomonas sp.]|uniref:hypothetical protein n=1 Tax=Sphingomonas sp. TaxID=28214 RepID=UPI0025F20954|nr:hypothetical protein [Sphingomonas sp.]
MKKLFVMALIAGACWLAIASESEAGCRRGGRGGLLSRLFHRGGGGCASCHR